MVSIMIVALIYLKIERKNILSSQSQLELTHHGTVEIPMETFKKKPILIEPDERRYHINSTKVKDFNAMSLLNYRNINLNRYLQISMVGRFYSTCFAGI